MRMSFAGWLSRCGVAIALAVCAAAPAMAEKRVALVVGNLSYRHVAPLANPGNDAKLIAETLSATGFRLIGGGGRRWTWTRRSSIFWFRSLAVKSSELTSHSSTTRVTACSCAVQTISYR